MNRREFLKSILVTSVVASTDLEGLISKTLEKTVNLSDDDFVAYVKWTWDVYVDNPSKCAYITNIGE